MDHNEKSSLRLLALTIFLSVVLLSYIGVLYKTQVLDYDYYLAQSVRTIAREESVEASRGIITDRNGKVLVSNRFCYNLTFDSSLLGAQDDENSAILRLVQLCQSEGMDWVDNLPITKQSPFSYTVDELSETQKKRFLRYLQDELKLVSADLTADMLTSDRLDQLGISPTELLDHMRQAHKVPAIFSLNEARAVLGIQYELSIRRLINTTAYILVEDISTEMISLISDGAYTGAKITTSSVREYETTYAAHILGTVGRIYSKEEYESLEGSYNMDDWIGKSGVESAFESYLRGADGRRVVSTNSAGKITGEFYSVAPEPGNSVELTIDLDLQKATEDALAETISAMNEVDGNTTSRVAGAAVVKVGSGELLALASYPTFDLSTYSQDYNELKTDPSEPLFNRATQGTYAPGSTFKPLTAIAALESGVITPYQKLLATGHWTYPGSPSDYANCWIYPGCHGRINVTEAITVSCNYFFAEMGYRLGMDTLNAYASAFGLGESTGIEIGDASGTLAEGKSTENLAPWAAFGQADYLCSPLQLSNYIATLVSGGKHYDAHLLKAVKSYDNTQVLSTGSTEPRNIIEISDASLDAVKEGMHNLTTSGSLASYFNQCVVEAGAKTGTAQITKDTKNNGVFVCFAPYDEPEIALAIVIEKGGSGSALASTAVNILNAYFTADEIGTTVIGENQLLP